MRLWMPSSQAMGPVRLSLQKLFGCVEREAISVDPDDVVEGGEEHGEDFELVVRDFLFWVAPARRIKLRSWKTRRKMMILAEGCWFRL